MAHWESPVLKAGQGSRASSSKLACWLRRLRPNSIDYSIHRCRFG